jgi:hypothetical protein
MSATMQKGGCGCGGGATAAPSGGASKSAGGCGCGGGGKGGCGCGCGASARGVDAAGDACAPCVETGFERPRFFAGQLLTEDDLDALVDYVNAKNRLHNARLFGAGVVCGLEVTCHPCRGGKVLVRPGYALDCCGHDLVLDCAREVDIAALIRALRAKAKGGWDCGDPCADGTTAPAQPQPAGASNAADGVIVEGKPPGDGKGHREYALYLRYTEGPTDLVAPYPTDESCGGACEATRVKEGVVFELRCPEPARREDLWTRIIDCLRTFTGTEQTTRDGILLQRRAAEISSALDRYDAKPAFAAEDVQRWQSSFAALAGRGAPTTEAETLETADLLRDLGGLAARAGRMQKTDPKGWAVIAKELGDTYSGTADVLGKTADALSPPVNQDEERPGAKRRGAKAAPVEPAPAKSGPIDLYVKSALARGIATGTVALVRQLEQGADLEQPALRIFSWGGVYEKTSAPAYAAALRSIRDVLVGRVADCTFNADCTLATDAAALTVSTPVTGVDPGLAEARGFVTTSDRAVGLLLRALADCLCAALNPPCAPCDDTAVLLARVEVVGCDVVAICNLARTFVLSATAVRYWVPPLTWLGQLLEDACCSVRAIAAGGDRAANRLVGDQRARLGFQLFNGPSLATVGQVERAFYGDALDPSLPSVAVAIAQLASERVSLSARSLPAAAWMGAVG